ncbi:hypothetical protein [Kineosporia sp. NBRC 101731]|uniref:hypothetical protein n=1 Tax=Kineosporia sp. NBRC 101731 TaxID=3032199 RepID=UPI0024A0A788|nr:hypothetical protein [Kineosporia sp. NBRC 101731]GLY32722.1 hypothetical protein Kisp02_60870 [Kineosporia sp. NBRC 101731]
MNHRSMSGTNLTLEMAQIAALEEHLTRRHHAPLTAGVLGLATVPEKAVLQHVTAVGPTCYPFVYGHFRASGDQSEVAVELHTQQLRRLSDTFRLHQHWGL